MLILKAGESSLVGRLAQHDFSISMVFNAVNFVYISCVQVCVHYFQWLYICIYKHM